MTESLSGLSERLGQAVEARGITQSNLAVRLGTTQPAVSQWLAGKKAPSIENLESLARVLRVNRKWLETGVGRMKAANQETDRAEYETNTTWAFRPAPPDGGRDYGNANVWSFDPGLDVLVREALQNIRDAALSPDKKVCATFRIIRLTGADKAAYLDALRWEELEEHLQSSAKGEQKLNTLLRDGLEELDRKGELLLLVIEDTGTVGLTGPERGAGNFTALCRNNLDSNKEGSKGGAGGAFGLGKAVLWRASRLSTVLFCSHLAKADEERSQFRVIGRCELAWHKVGKKEYAGPGWFGRKDKGAKDEAETAVSYWDNETLAQDLYLDREGTGTSACVVGFHDASADRDRPPVDLAKELVNAAARNFFPALVADKLAVRVEVYDSRKQYVDRKPEFSQAVNPSEFTPTYVRMLRALAAGETAEALGDNREVVARPVGLTVPKRDAAPKHAEQEHEAVLLLTAADDEPQGGADTAERVNHVAMFRGPGMVVQQKSLAGVCLGARPFHALLLCGKAPEFAAPDLGRPNPTADAAAEQFLRTAEPPSHNQWTATPDLKAVYARGCKARLDEFLKAVADAVRDLVKPTPRDMGDGPQSLKELFRLGSDPVPTERPRVSVDSGEVRDGRWHVTARIRMKPRKTKVRLTPAVYFLAETGTGLPVRWESLEARRNCTVEKDSLVLEPDTREVQFFGVTDPKSHPVPASDSCATVDVKKLVPVREVKA